LGGGVTAGTQVPLPYDAPLRDFISDGSIGTAMGHGREGGSRLTRCPNHRSNPRFPLRAADSPSLTRGGSRRSSHARWLSVTHRWAVARLLLSDSGRGCEPRHGSDRGSSASNPEASLIWSRSCTSWKGADVASAAAADARTGDADSPTRCQIRRALNSSGVRERRGHVVSVDAVAARRRGPRPNAVMAVLFRAE
jgi:hypothetical protein